MADSLEGPGDISRRRILLGAAWTAPAIVIATSVPARAASLPADQGVAFMSLAVSFQAYYWNNSQMTGMPAVIVQPNFQNAPSPAPDPTPIVAMQLTYQVPVGDITNPAWGLGTDAAPNAEGVAAGTTWALASPVSVTAGVATLVFNYTGAPIPQYGNLHPTLWVQAGSSQVGASAIVMALATHLNGDVSSDLAVGIAVLVADDPPGGL